MSSNQNKVEILVVEDSPTQAERLRYTLEQHNFSVLVARDGKQALALLSQHKPTLVISDIMMPEMNGYQL
jgi:CheY-like chemotaxis protein